MAALGEDLAHLDSVRVPEKYEPDDPPPAPPGDLPPWSTTLRIARTLVADQKRRPVGDAMPRLVKRTARACKVASPSA
jgi:hypothetical protein